MASLFLCMSVGFLFNKLNILPKETGKVISKLVVWVFYPALCFITMTNYFTPQTFRTHATNLILSCIGLLAAILLSYLFVGLFAKKGTYERGLYRYALTFANAGYMGDPLVLAIFGDAVLSYYKVYTLPISLITYTWGVSMLVPQNGKKAFKLTKLLNPPTVAMLLGIVVGATGLGSVFPAFAINTLQSLKACMGPSAMLLAGFTVANYSLTKMLTNKKTYLATLLRLVVIPSLIIVILFGIKEAANLIFSLNISNSFLFLTFFATATPLGLNTVVFPESYGADPEPGAGMTLISHTLCLISMPLMYSLMTVIFGTMN